MVRQVLRVTNVTSDCSVKTSYLVYLFGTFPPIFIPAKIIFPSPSFLCLPELSLLLGVLMTLASQAPAWEGASTNTYIISIYCATAPHTLAMWGERT